MHILQRAVAEIAAGVQAQQFLHLGVPECGNVFGFDLAFNQRPLDFIAQDDVRGVGHFVGIDADQAGLHTRHQAVQVGGFKRRLVAEGLADQRRQLLHEAGMAAQLHLKAQALAFMQGHRSRVRHRLAEPVARQVLLIAAVAGFMHGSHQAAQEVVFAEARGHAHILGHATAERVRADVEPAGFKVKAQEPHDLLTQHPLRRQREGADGGHHRLGRLARGDLLDQAWQPLPDFTEHAVHVGAGHARLKAVHHRVVLSHAIQLRQQLGLFAAGGQHVAEVLDEAFPVVGRALRAPGVFAA